MDIETDRGSVRAQTFGALAARLVNLSATEALFQTNDETIRVTGGTSPGSTSPLTWLGQLAEAHLETGLRVEGGDIPADYDQGVVLAVDPGIEVLVLVAWSWSGAQTWVPFRTLRAADEERAAWTRRALAVEAQDELSWADNVSC